MDSVGGIGPIGQHAREQPEIGHTMHDDAAELCLAETPLHVVVIEVERIVVERSVAEFPDALARYREFRPVDAIPRRQPIEKLAHLSSLSHRTDRPAAAGADRLALLIEEDIVVDGEEPSLPDEFVERAGFERDPVTRPCRLIVAPGL